MGTPLNLVYDAFFIKANDNFLYKNSQVFQYFKTGVAKSLKTSYDDLRFNYFKNNLVFVVFSQVKVSGDIKIKINSNEYTVSLLESDSNINIANKIKNQLQPDFVVTIDERYDYPIILVDSNINLNEDTFDFDLSKEIFIDEDKTGLNLIVTREYSGEFENIVGDDTIELISLYMLYEHKRFKKSKLDEIKQHIGTKDFNKLPDKFEEYKSLDQSMKDLSREIEIYRNEFYKYN
jgi:hypothetical protein